MKNKTIILGSLCFCLLFSGCRLPLANYARDEMFPQETSSKVIMSPILLPTYMIFCVVDITIVNPIAGTRNVPEAVESLWGWQNQPAWVGLGLLLPVKLAATPVWAVGTTMFSEQFAQERTPYRINRSP